MNEWSQSKTPRATSFQVSCSNVVELVCPDWDYVEWAIIVRSMEERLVGRMWCLLRCCGIGGLPGIDQCGYQWHTLILHFNHQTLSLTQSCGYNTHHTLSCAYLCFWWDSRRLLHEDPKQPVPTVAPPASLVQTNAKSHQLMHSSWFRSTCGQNGQEGMLIQHVIQGSPTLFQSMSQTNCTSVAVGFPPLETITPLTGLWSW